MLNDLVTDRDQVMALCDKYREAFEFYDKPRLAKEVLPSGVKILDCVRYECLRPVKEDPESRDKCFVLIHGGAFVYGYKELDRCFGMHLAKRTGMSVLNFNYDLMPGISLTDMITRLMFTIAEAARLFGYNILYLCGDSAGAYIAYVVALISRNPLIATGFNIEDAPALNIEGAGLICGCYDLPKDRFPGALFEMEGARELKSYAYDLKQLADADKNLKVAIVTGDKDFLRQDNLDLAKALTKAGCKVRYLDLSSKGEYELYHVFPITAPDMPQSQEALDLIAGIPGVTW